MEFKSFSLEAVIKSSSNKRSNPRWCKTDQHGLRKVEVGGRQFGVLTNHQLSRGKTDEAAQVRHSESTKGRKRR